MAQHKLKPWIKYTFGAIAFCAIFAYVSYTEHNYIRKDCQITEIGNGLITIEDSVGYEWNALDNGEFTVGDKVSVQMNDNCTPNIISDDIIIKIKRR